MLPNMALIDSFKNLPYLALKEVSKHLMDRDRVLLSVISPEWEQSISSQQVHGFISHLIATKKKFEIEITINGMAPRSVPNVIGYQRYEETKMIVQFINSDTDKEVITEEIDNQSRSTISFNRSITVYRKNWEVDGNQRILEVARILNQKFQLYLLDVTMENATWMTQNDLISLDSRTAKIGDNKFTNNDFNVFLHSWMAGNQDGISSYSFKVGENVKIDQVIRGLITEKWNPAKRDRKFIPRSDDNVAQPPIDMADGYDMFRPIATFDSNLATVHITDNTLYFVVWKGYKFEEQLTYVKWTLWLSNRELLRGAPGSPKWNHWTERRRKNLESLRNITGDPEADVLENEFSDIDEDHYSDSD